MKTNVFKGATFHIINESYEQSEGALEIIEQIERMIAELGGRLCDDPSAAMYVVHEDGYDQQIW